MDSKHQTAQDNLAFLRELVTSSNHSSVSGGSIFLVGGLLYGIQVLFHWCQAVGLIVSPSPVTLLVSTIPTVIFTIVLLLFLHRQRHNGTMTMARRALDSAFSAAGICNLILATVFGWVAYQQKNLTTWLLYPIVVFALQGAAWQIAFQLQRRRWMGVTSLGWFLASLGLGLTLGTHIYLLLAALSLLLLMALPGALMLRAEKTIREL
jgi:hypothetical protein